MKYYDYHHLDHVKEQHRSRKTLWITLCVTLFFTVVEVVGGILSDSLALLSDSAHMLSDVIALSLSMVAIYLASRSPNQKYTFGFLRFEIIASFLNGLALAVIAVGIFIEGIRRLITPQEVGMATMLIIASVGLAVNLILTLILRDSVKEEENLNIKSALWHFIGDLLSSIGIILAALLIMWTGYVIFDPIISLIIGAVIFGGGVKIIRESYLILMESVPEKFDLETIRQDINNLPGVKDVHELHLWSVSTDHYSLTAHVFADEAYHPFQIISAINSVLKEKYNITHSTIQVEHPAIHDHGEYGNRWSIFGKSNFSSEWACWQCGKRVKPKGEPT